MDVLKRHMKIHNANESLEPAAKKLKTAQETSDESTRGPAAPENHDFIVKQVPIVFKPSNYCNGKGDKLKVAREAIKSKIWALKENDLRQQQQEEESETESLDSIAPMETDVLKVLDTFRDKVRQEVADYKDFVASEVIAIRADLDNLRISLNKIEEQKLVDKVHVTSFKNIFDDTRSEQSEIQTSDTKEEFNKNHDDDKNDISASVKSSYEYKPFTYPPIRYNDINDVIERLCNLHDLKKCGKTSHLSEILSIEQELRYQNIIE